MLYGGGGRDRFDYDAVTESGTTATARDVIRDFIQSEDRIDLRTIDASTSVGGNQAFAFIGTAAFSAEGQGRYFHSGGNTIVQVNTTGAATPEMAIALEGLFTLSSDDFLL